MSHKEGGWPKDVDHQETDQVNRFIKKIEKDEGFLESTLNLADRMEHHVKQNNAVEIYGDYFTREDPATDYSQPGARTVNIFTDPTKRHRPVSSLSWCPDGGTMLAVGYSSWHFPGDPLGSPTQGYIFRCPFI